MQMWTAGAKWVLLVYLYIELDCIYTMVVSQAPKVRG